MDLREFFESWPYDSENLSSNFRRTELPDGRMILQVREPLGIQQMEYLGRPDGIRPHGQESWFHYFQSIAEKEIDFQLSTEDCQLLMQEGILYYQRYLILFQMNDWEGVVRDTQRNLHYFDFVKDHALHKEDYMRIDQYRPYLLRMNAVARAYLLWAAGDFDQCISILKETLKTLECLEPLPTQIFDVELERSVKHLKNLIEEFEKKRPESKIDQLRREQRQAILTEDFERAANIRDQIRVIDAGSVSEN